MRPRRGHRTHILLDLWACFLLPVYTLLFAGSREWLGTNFSVRAVLGEDYYRGFLLWGLLAGGYFFVMTTRLALALRGVWMRLFVHMLTLTACLSLAYSVAIPYLPKYLPRWADLHVALASGSCVLFMAALLALLVSWRRRAGCRLFWLGWWAIVLGSGLLFALGGMVTTALEVFFTISAALFVRKLWLWVGE